VDSPAACRRLERRGHMDPYIPKRVFREILIRTNHEVEAIWHETVCERRPKSPLDSVANDGPTHAPGD
jgi:hypothetical protein